MAASVAVALAAARIGNDGVENARRLEAWGADESRDGESRQGGRGAAAEVAMEAGDSAVSRACDLISAELAGGWRLAW